LRSDQKLDPPEFYRALGREDLARAYRRRHFVMIGGYVASAVAFAVAGVLNVAHTSNFSVCNHLPADEVPSCTAQHRRSATPVLIALGVGLAGTAVGTYFYRNPHPIDENDAKALADVYNQRLRGQLGLPVASRRSILRELAVTPYIADRDAGLALGARF
jgi:hypothetical protein